MPRRDRMPGSVCLEARSWERRREKGMSPVLAPLSLSMPSYYKLMLDAALNDHESADAHQISIDIKRYAPSAQPLWLSLRTSINDCDPLNEEQQESLFHVLKATAYECKGMLPSTPPNGNRHRLLPIHELFGCLLAPLYDWGTSFLHIDLHLYHSPPRLLGQESRMRLSARGMCRLEFEWMNKCSSRCWIRRTRNSWNTLMRWT